MAFQVRDNRGGNWFWLHNAIIDRHGAALGPYGIAVYAALCRHSGGDQTTWISQGKLAAEIGTSRQQVNKTIARLESLGLLGVEDREDAISGRTTSLYALLPPVAEDDRGVGEDARGSQPRRQPIQLRNKTQGTRGAAPQQDDYGIPRMRYGSLVRTPGFDDDAAE